MGHFDGGASQNAGQDTTPTNHPVAARHNPIFQFFSIYDGTGISKVLYQILRLIFYSFASPLITSRNNVTASAAKAIILPSLSPPKPVESSLL